MLVAVTEGDGTGVQAAIDGYHVAGKTATAQKVDPKTGLYSIDKFIASFVGFVPARDPVVAIAVVIDEPMIEHAGGAVAAPVFREVASMALEVSRPHAARHGRTPTPRSSRARRIPANAAVRRVSRRRRGSSPPVQDVSTRRRASRAGKVRVPDMTGFPLRLAIQKSVELGVKPRVEGTGLLSRQVPAPGEVVDQGSEVVLVFEPAT